MIKTAVVGATGVVGQGLINRLMGHPWFKLTRVVASERSRGKKLEHVLAASDGVKELPEDLAGLEIISTGDFRVEDVDLIFSAVEAGVARGLEPEYARVRPVVSTTSAFRHDPHTPLLMGGVNAEHVPLLRVQQKKHGWQGFIVPKPNCTVAGLVITLKPIQERFGLKRVALTSLQALSGAGRSPGVASLDIIDNILPFIAGEEEKVEQEPKKILGVLTGEEIKPATFTINATCTRVPVLDGHLLSIMVETEKRTTPAEVGEVMKTYGREHELTGLPHAPQEILTVTEDPFRPQPRLDRNKGNGMTVTVGRLASAPVFPGGIKYVALSSNTGIGAAGGAVLMAEYLAREFLNWV